MASMFDINFKMKLVDFKDCIKSEKIEEVVDSILHRIFYFSPQEIAVISKIIHDERPDLESQIHKAEAHQSDERLDYDSPSSISDLGSMSGDEQQKNAFIHTSRIELQRLTKDQLMDVCRELYVGYQIMRIQFARLTKVETIKKSLEGTFMNMLKRLHEEKLKNKMLTNRRGGGEHDNLKVNTAARGTSPKSSKGSSPRDKKKTSKEKKTITHKKGGTFKDKKTITQENQKRLVNFTYSKIVASRWKEKMLSKKNKNASNKSSAKSGVKSSPKKNKVAKSPTVSPRISPRMSSSKIAKSPKASKKVKKKLIEYKDGRKRPGSASNKNKTKKKKTGKKKKKKKKNAKNNKNANNLIPSASNKSAKRGAYNTMPSSGHQMTHHTSGTFIENDLSNMSDTSDYSDYSDDSDYEMSYSQSHVNDQNTNNSMEQEDDNDNDQIELSATYEDKKAFLVAKASHLHELSGALNAKNAEQDELDAELQKKMEELQDFIVDIDIEVNDTGED